MPPPSNEAPRAGYRVLLVVGGTVAGRASFMQAAALDVDPASAPRRTGPGTVRLEHGRTADRAIRDWLMEARHGRTRRTEVVIVVFDDRRTEIARWRVNGAFPAKVYAPGLQAGGNETAIESLEIDHQGLTLEPGGTAGGWMESPDRTPVRVPPGPPANRRR